MRIISCQNNSKSWPSYDFNVLRASTGPHFMVGVSNSKLHPTIVPRAQQVPAHAETMSCKSLSCPGAIYLFPSLVSLAQTDIALHGRLKRTSV